MTDWTNRIIAYKEIPANQLLANPVNARRHPPRQRDALRGSLDTLGWVAPVIVNVANGGYVLDGHARIEEALTKDETTLIPVIEVELSEDEEVLFLASYDWITSLAEYDRESLDSLLRDIQTDEPRLQAMLSEMASEQGLTFGEQAGPPDDPGGQEPAAAQAKWNVSVGDVWHIQTGSGYHRLLCGDSTDTNCRDRLLEGTSEYTFFCDPFYNEEIVDKLSSIWNFSNAAFLTGGTQMRAIINCIEHYHEGVLLGCSSIPQMGNENKLFYEHKVIFWVGKQLNFGIGFSSVIRSDESAARKVGGVYHHTAKPANAIEKILQPFSQTIVVDAFAGLGSGFVAAHRLGRWCYGIDIKPNFCAATLERLSQMGLSPERVT